MTSPTMNSASATTAAPSRRVVDAPTRMFHALFALSFLGAYLSADAERWRAMHISLGYTMAGLLAFRLLYGLVGPRQARLGALWRKLSGGADWLRASLHSQGLAQLNWRQGQNLLMALAVASMLALVLPLTLSGYAAYHEWGDRFGGELFAELHEGLGNALLVVVLAHLALLLVLSLLRRQNQAMPMLSGRQAGRGPDLVSHNRAGLAAVLLLAVLAFMAWRWHDAPAGLLPSTVSVEGRALRPAHDDD